MDCQTQWRVSPLGRPLGLDYTGVEAVMRMHGKACDSALFAQLQVMEFAALEELSTAQ